MTNQLEEKYIAMIKENKEEFYRLAYSYVKNEQDALDVIGEATYKGLKSLGKLKNDSYLKTWFYRIVINEGISVLRKKSKMVYDTDFIEAVVKESENGTEFIDLYKGIDKLPEKYKTVLILKYMKAMKISEIAEVLSTNENTVKSRLKRSMERLKLIMEVS